MSFDGCWLVSSYWSFIITYWAVEMTGIIIHWGGWDCHQLQWVEIFCAKADINDKPLYWFISIISHQVHWLNNITFSDFYEVPEMFVWNFSSFKRSYRLIPCTVSNWACRLRNKRALLLLLSHHKVLQQHARLSLLPRIEQRADELNRPSYSLQIYSLNDGGTCENFS